MAWSGAWHAQQGRDEGRRDWEQAAGSRRSVGVGGLSHARLASRDAVAPPPPRRPPPPSPARLCSLVPRRPPRLETRARGREAGLEREGRACTGGRRAAAVQGAREGGLLSKMRI